MTPTLFRLRSLGGLGGWGFTLAVGMSFQIPDVLVFVKFVSPGTVGIRSTGLIPFESQQKNKTRKGYTGRRRLGWHVCWIFKTSRVCNHCGGLKKTAKYLLNTLWRRTDPRDVKVIWKDASIRLFISLPVCLQLLPYLCHAFLKTAF